MPKVMIISHPFPPTGGSGVQRMAKFCKYLPGFGWQPVVLTANSAAYLTKDETLLHDIPQSVPVHRTGSLELANLSVALRRRLGLPLPTAASDDASLHRARKPASGLKQAISSLKAFLLFPWQVPDPALGWVPIALREGRRLVQQEGVSLLYVTGPPFSAHLLGPLLSRATGTLYAVDYRDPWTLCDYRKRFTGLYSGLLGRLQQAIEGRMERYTLRDASAVVFANEAERQAYIAAYPRWAAKMQTIHNGYDPQDFDGIEPPPRPRKALRIVHAGRFHAGIRSPVPFLQAAEALLQEAPHIPLEIRLVGSFSAISFQEAELALFQRLQERGALTCTGYLPHREAIQEMLGADLLLLVIDKMASTPSAKIYEYLATGKPILALAPLDSPAAQLLAEAKAGETVATDDLPGIATALSRWYDAWAVGRLRPTPDREAIARYSRKTLAGQLAALFDSILAEGKPIHER